jgi:hypothetical protein
MTAYEQKITLAEMRASGVRDILIYYDHRCGHDVETNADGSSDDVIEPGCPCCGKKGEQVRPKFSHARMGTGS